MELFYISKKKPKEFQVLSIEDANELLKLSSVSEKMEKLCTILEVTPEEYNTRRSICGDIREILRKYYPDCLVLMCGSSVNGLGFKQCDLDLLFLPFPGYCNLEANTATTEGEKPDIPQPAKIKSGAVERSVLTKLDEMSHLKFIRTAFTSEKSKIRRSMYVTASCPIIKIFLRNHRILCELSANNRLVVFNSELLQFLVKLDPRVKPLIMTLRFWGKSLFIRKNFFSSYAFTLLIIFFLQTRSPPILPSIKELMDLSGFSRMTAGWQTAFTTDVNAVPRSKNTENMGDLLHNFFDFYWNFDFIENVISPYLGRVLTIQDLKTNKDARWADFEVKAFNIQDPFILSRNVYRNEGHRTMFKFGLHLAHQILNDAGNFNKLFNPYLYQNVYNIQHQRIYNDERLKLVSLFLDSDLIAKLKIKENNFKKWYDLASESVFDILQYALLIESEVVDKISWDKATPKCEDVEMKNVSNETNGKTSTKGYSLPELELLTSIQCVLYSRTWIGRKSKSEISLDEPVSNEFSNSILESEHRISRALVKGNPILNSPKPLLCFRCECYRYNCAELSDVVMALKPLTSSKEFHQVATFLASYIPKTVKKILLNDS